MWDIKLKAKNEQTNKLIDTNNIIVVTRGEGGGEGLKVTNVKYMVMEGDLTMGGEHTIRYTDDVLYKCTLEIYTILLIMVMSHK